ncbi:cytochrome c oxidase assembly protein [Streptomyces sp. RKAG337]|uniref:cytochrome c oxidase assembly protein n=1 Tax=Streptomyces sp. RKAG337 TaxID=2893404 RepID=UPI0020333A5C|nr:cytochrome c oxidase assembly protein [Streptomyces sp. RKAG337]MCM2429071.1 cytochrome c oxidase assembly protein [Streptomyces sp. RKAG337]
MAAALGTTAAALPELTVSTFLGAWQLDGVALAAVVLLGGFYVAGVRRHRRAGGRWPAARTTAFLVLGLGAIVVATMSGLAVYGRVLFWPAAVQNIVLDLIAPLGLALGDPLALAAPDGPLHGVLTGRVVRLLTYPLVSSAAVLGSELTIYFTPYFETALRHDAVRQLMHLQLLLTGCLFVLPMLTHQELLPRWCTHPVRAALVFLDGLFDSLPGIVVMTSGTLVAGHWYASQPRTWGPTLQQDQLIGGGLMLTLAELVGLPFLIAVFAQWWRTDRAKTAELDARLDLELLPAAPAKPATTTTPASAHEPAPAVPEMTRPWWETDAGEVGQRMRRRS